MVLRPICNEEHPGIYPFYDTVGNHESIKMKRGGRRKKLKAKMEKAQNENRINIKIYTKDEKRKQLIAPKRRFANPPSVQLSSTFAIPNVSSFFQPPPPQPIDHRRYAQEEVEVPNAKAPVVLFAPPNPTGIEAKDTRAKRITPSGLPDAGTFYANPSKLNKALDELDAELALAKTKSVLPAYFAPTGRDNIPQPKVAQRTGAPTVDYQPNRGQEAVPEEKEEARASFSLLQPRHYEPAYKIRTRTEGKSITTYPDNYEVRPPGSKGRIPERQKLTEYYPLPKSIEKHIAESKAGQPLSKITPFRRGGVF